MANIEGIVQEASPETALHIGRALAYRRREAQAAGLGDLATEIGSVESAAYETARQEAYLQS